MSRTRPKEKILAISGSTRKNSSNQAILKKIAGLFKDILEVEIFEGIDQLPHFNPDLDNNDAPLMVRNFREQIIASSAVIICTPEYVFSLPGSLKNAIEWTVSTTVFSDKPVAIIVASASGEKAFESLDLVMKTVGAKVEEGSKLLIKGVKGLVGPHGDINSPEIIHKLKNLAENLSKLIEEAKVSAGNNI